ncbi:SHOCT domain-containing protein [Halomarina salina]|uniref:SHOCT domain-containing protein n=1 Tax=Halomarina salina TaxID=1872699 RepID=A0ABD5RS54_9EURY|nr:SHOCT domain-containing protein [Halomarina salina]
MSEDTSRSRLHENATEIASTIVTGIWLAALLTGQSWWLGALILGYVVVVPIVAVLFGDDEDREEWWEDDAWWGSSEDWWGGWGTSTTDETSTSDEPADPTADETPLETLRRRYAAGELTDAQFERKLERLLETDTLENVEERAARTERDRLRDREAERE